MSDDTWAILASGPSMSAEVAESVRGLKVIAVSNVYELAPWADVLVSNDRAWWINNEKAFDFEGEKFCGLCVETPRSVTKFPGAMSGSNSALLALQVAVSKGAKRVLLFGVDLGGNHYFGDHTPPLKNPSPQRFEIFKKQFNAYRPAAVEIFNCSPHSELKAYPFANAKDFLPTPPPKDGKDGKDGLDGKDADPEEIRKQVSIAVSKVKADPGPRGLRGPEGPPGPMGPMPDHQWDGTRIRFEDPSGWGPFVDLQGPPGKGSSGGFMSSGSGGGMTPLQATQLQTLINIFGGWIATPPVVAIEETTIDELEVTAEGSATGFYAGIPSGLPVDAAYEWDWGDGETSTTLNASHTYSEAGTYTIGFRARNHIGWSNPVTEEVTVTGEGPIPDPQWANVKMLVQVVSGAIVDRKGRHTVSNSVGAVTVSGDDMVFDGGSALQVTGNQEDFAFGEETFTVEEWIDTSTAEGYQQMVDFYSATGTNFAHYRPPGTGIGWYVGGINYIEGGGTNMATGELVNVCVQRAMIGGVMTTAGYIGGVYQGHFADPVVYAGCATPLNIGRQTYDNSSHFDGTMKGVRITSPARYAPPGSPTGNITVDAWPVAAG